MYICWLYCNITLFYYRWPFTSNYPRKYIIWLH